MKVLLINTFKTRGGAAQAALRIFYGLKQYNIDAALLVEGKPTGDPQIYRPAGICYHHPFHKIRGYLDLLKPFLIRRKRIQFSTAWLPDRNVLRRIRDINPDIIHLHWISKGFIQFKSLSDFNKPIVWTMHDMWPFTGGCHYSGDCQKYTDFCGTCPMLKSEKVHDLSRRLNLAKHEIYNRIDNLIFVTPSHWLAECARQSSLLSKAQIYTIPNPIDTELFKPIDQIKARTGLGLPLREKIVLFTAMKAVEDERKGYRYLIEALSKCNTGEILLMVVGSDKPTGIEPKNLNIRFMGVIDDPETLSKCYNVCDVMALPSLQDNLPNTGMESLSCGKPVVAFNVGGIPDMIDHKKNGYLATYKSSEDLYEGIRWVLYEADKNTLNLNARRKALNQYDQAIVMEKYLDLYRTILNKSKP